MTEKSHRTPVNRATGKVMKRLNQTVHGLGPVRLICQQQQNNH